MRYETGRGTSVYQNNAVKNKASGSVPATKYCTLFVRNEGLPSMYFEVQVTVNKVLIDQFKSQHLVLISRFLNKYDIYEGDLADALEIFETHGHNVIEFGMFGTPVTSKFDGSIH